MKEEQFYRIEAYLRGELPPDEKAAFEAELKGDPALAEEVALHRLRNKVAELIVEDDLRAEASKWNAEWKEQEEKPPAPGKKGRLPWWAITGIAVALTALAWLLFRMARPTPGPPEKVGAEQTMPGDEPALEEGLQPQDSLPAQQGGPQGPRKGLQENQPEQRLTLPDKPAPSGKPRQDGPAPQAVAAQFLQEPPVFAGEAVRSRDAAGQRFKAATALLLQKNYRAAIDSLRTFQPGSQFYPDARYNIGCAYYAQGNYRSAIPFLKTSAENEAYLYAGHARWYLSLSLLAINDKTAAAEQLDEIAKDPKGDFYEKTRRLQQLLEL